MECLVESASFCTFHEWTLRERLPLSELLNLHRYHVSKVAEFLNSSEIWRNACKRAELSNFLVPYVTFRALPNRNSCRAH